jgi:hypothetical protein
MQIIKKANPNRHGPVLLEKDEDGMYWLTEPDADGEMGDPSDLGTDEAAALAMFDKIVKAWRETPNWELQAEYDAAHGTDNGYAPWQYGREY